MEDDQHSLVGPFYSWSRFSLVKENRCDRSNQYTGLSDDIAGNLVCAVWVYINYPVDMVCDHAR